MYIIHFTDNTGIKDLTKRSDVRMNIVMQHMKGRKVEKVFFNGEDVTESTLEGLPV